MTDLFNPDLLAFALGLIAHAWHGAVQAGKREERRRADHDTLKRGFDDFRTEMRGEIHALRDEMDELRAWSRDHERDHEFYDRRPRQPLWPPQSEPRSQRRRNPSSHYSRGYAR